MTFGLAADPPLVMRSLEGSNVVFVTPDANWISPMQALPPLDPKVKLRPIPLGPRSMSISSIAESISAPSSPVKSLQGLGLGHVQGNNHNHPMQQQQQQQQHPQHQQQQQQQNGGRPSMVTRAHTHSGQPVHYHPINGQSISVSHMPNPQNMSVPAPGYYPAPGPYRSVSMSHGNMAPPPGNYPQPGYIYPTMQAHQHQHPHPPGAAPMPYPQMYPGYTYVTTSTGPHNYFAAGPPVLVRGASGNSGPPVLVRGSSTSSSRSTPYENGQMRQGQGQGQSQGQGQGQGGMSMGSNGGIRNRPDGPKVSRKNRSKKAPGQNYEPGMAMASAGNPGGMPTRRGSKEQLNISNQSDGDLPGAAARTTGTGTGTSNDTDMPKNRSQNEMPVSVSDSSGGAKPLGRRDRVKNTKSKRDGNNGTERRKDVNFDANQFPALSPSSPSKAAVGKKTAAISGYAAALLQQNRAALLPNPNECPAKESSFAEDYETNTIVEKVGEMKLNSIEDADRSQPIAVGALTGTPLSESSSENVNVNKDNDPVEPEKGPLKADTVRVPVTTPEKLDVKLDNDGPTPKEAENSDPIESKVPVQSTQTPDSPLVNNSPPSPAPAPPAAWGNKRSFIDVVRKTS